MEAMANIALRAARLAGEHIVRGFDRPDLIKIAEKGPNDFVTNIDQEAETIIIETLREKYPGHRITAEESGTSGDESSEYEWIIDPLDGTTNFTRQVPHFCVSIACLYRGKIEHGIIVDPLRQEEFGASRGKGSTMNGKRIRCSDQKDLDGAIIAMAGSSRNSEAGSETEMFGHLLEANAIMRQQGSAALDLAYLAAGRIDGLFLGDLKAWDMAAGVILATEAGCLVGDYTGGASHMKTGNIVAGAPKCFKTLSPAVRKYLAG